MINGKVVIASIDIESNGINGFNADMAYIITFSYRIYSEDENEFKSICLSISDYPSFKERPYDDRLLLEDIYKVLQKVDIIAGQFSSRFDYPMLVTRIKKQTGKDLVGHAQLDIWKVCKDNFKLSNNRLKLQAAYWESKYQKIDNGLIWAPMWWKCAAGDMSAFKLMIEYNLRDVDCTDGLVRLYRAYWPKDIVGKLINKSQIQFPKYLFKTERFKTNEDTLSQKEITGLQKSIDIPSAAAQSTQCWRWTGGYATLNHPKYEFRGKSTTPQRVVYNYFMGEVDSDKQVTSKCYNPNCVNPRHLMLMSKDKAPGYHAKKQGKRYVSDVQVKAIKKDAQRLTNKELVKKYNLAKSTISNIIAGRRRK